MNRILHGLGPAMARGHLVDLLRGGGGALAGLLLLALALSRTDPTLALHLIAPFGATAVLIFAVPNSPLAQPWSAVAGNTVSALVAAIVILALPPGIWLAPVATGCAIVAMMLARALHPPGGAVALLAALSPDAIRAEGLWFALSPVALGTVALVLLAIVWNRAVGRVYPFRQPGTPGPHGTRDAAPAARLGLTPDELETILERLRQTANLGVADLARLVGAAEEASAAHRLESTTCGGIMSRDLVTVPPNAPMTDVARIFTEHRFHSLPVTGADAEYLGTIFQLGVIRAAGAVGGLTASALMEAHVPTAGPSTPIGALLPLLSDGGAEGVPILEGNRIVGIVTRSDLISALARAVARSALLPGAES